MKKIDGVASVKKGIGKGRAFTQSLLRWHANDNDRQMPWKGEKDPYRIWLSEVILQQTRVAQGIKYYENFISTFPDVHALARAPEEKIFKLWEGLGYYSRCKNLIASARLISEKRNGVFPSDYASLIALKGIGEYTAAAIGSFAYNLPYAVVDGNVLRVLSRIYGSSMAVDSREGKKFFNALALELLPKDNPGEYNQAIMDFGAVVCKPQPECNACFFSSQCVAFQRGLQLELPVKEKKVRVRKRFFHYFFSVSGKYTAVARRNSKDIWQELFEFPKLETSELTEPEKAAGLFSEKYGLKNGDFIFSRETVRQKLTHQELYLYFHTVNFSSMQAIEGYEWIEISSLRSYPFPRSLAIFLDRELTGL